MKCKKHLRILLLIFNLINNVIKMAKKTNKSVFILEFVGSLIFLWLAFSSKGVFSNPFWASGSASLWSPLLFGAAVISSISLFLISFAHLVGVEHEMMANGAVLMTLLSAASLIALYYTSPYFLLVLVGFIISFIGTGLNYAKS
jgi:hypothetical protein